MIRLLKEPLLQFLLVGLALYLGLSVLYPLDADDRSRITVSKAAMLEFLQYQHKSFDDESADTFWSELSEPEKAALTNDFIRQEVLYREALKLGLDSDDQIIRQRLIQKVEFVLQGFTDQQAGFSDDDIRAYFALHSNRYLMPETATFTHVFLSNSKYQADELEPAAEELLQQLRLEQAPFEGAAQFGDRFHFHRNYVSRSPQFVESHFGPEFAAQLFDTEPDSQWVGPVYSPYGLHLVMLRRLEPSWSPQYEDVAGTVLADMRREHKARVEAESFQRLSGGYQFVYTDLSAPDVAE